MECLIREQDTEHKKHGSNYTAPLNILPLPKNQSLISSSITKFALDGSLQLDSGPGPFTIQY